MQKQRTLKEHGIAQTMEYTIDPKLGLKLKHAFQITLYCHFCLTMVTPTLWYVQVSTHILHEFQEDEVKGAMCEN